MMKEEKATEMPDGQTNESFCLSEEIANLTASLKKAESDKNLWLRLYNEQKEEADNLREIVKALNVYAKLV